jgi:peptidyl-Lys metalloendopeptidase
MNPSRTRSMSFSACALVAGALSFTACAGAPDDGDVLDPAGEPATDAAPEADHDDLSFTLAAPSAIAAARDAVNVHVTLTNVAGHPVRVRRYLTPLDGIKEDLFRVARDGVAAEYLGRHYKWAAPQASDFITLDAGQSVGATVDLATAYDFATTGSYTVAYGHDPHAAAAPADPVAHLAAGVTVQVEGRGFVVPGAEPGAQLTTTGCSSSRIASLTTAYASARTMAAAALSYLTNTTPSGTLRYTTWFGAYTSARWSTARSHFSAISQRLSNEVADCTCTDSAYAYVYPSQPYKIYLCNAFWSAPNVGTDSRAGTLIHEMSHFNVVAGTNDNAYGQSACKNLARSSPTRALDNADSHEYFAENTPFQN